MKDKKTVIFVDDYQMQLDMTKKKLTNSDYDIVLVTDGYYLFEELSKKKPDLIILDLMMPKLDGQKTCRTLKDSDEYKDIPIIVATGATDSVERQKAKMFGADDYVTKPYKFSELDQKIRMYLGINK